MNVFVLKKKIHKNSEQSDRQSRSDACSLYQTYRLVLRSESAHLM